MPKVTDPKVLASHEFISTVLNWDPSSFSQFNISEENNTLTTLPKCWTNSEWNIYYHTFIPLILEESKAIISQGLEKIERGKEIPLKLTFNKETLAYERRNPDRIELKGDLPKKYDGGTSCIALLLQLDNQNKIALADHHSPYFSVKLIGWVSARGSTYNNINGYILGSLITQLRMYIVCKIMPRFSCLEQILTGTPTKQLPNLNKTNVGSQNLNDSQLLAVKKFLALPQGLQLLQGPPGTGKTITIIALIAALCSLDPNLQQRILVCAPSNKAVQVLAKRLVTSHPEIRSILVGVEGKLIPELAPIFIHTWGMDVAREIDIVLTDLGKISTENYNHEFFCKIKEKICQIQTKINHFLPLANFNNELRSLETLITKISDTSVENIYEIQQIQGKVLNVKSHLQNLQVSKDLAGTQLEKQLLQNAQVVFATLSICGRNLMQNAFNILIVDEASQAVEAETLIAFQGLPRKILLVGDTNQLPATVLSIRAQAYNYQRSMMWRLLEECEYPYDMLTTQYRMHAKIRLWPGEKYYNGRLEDAIEIANRDLILDKPTNPSYEPYAFINVDGEEQNSHSSFQNIKEAYLVVDLINYYINVRKLADTQIGVITFYSAQVELIKSLLIRGKTEQLVVNTVDGFQGEEKDVIILSFVRANHKGIIGFLHDFRRLNVAITRAKNILIMLGHAKTFLQRMESDIAMLIQNSQQRKRFFFPSQIAAEIKSKHPKQKNKHTPKHVSRARHLKKRQTLTTTTNTRAKSKKIQQCRFFRPNQPNSCRSGTACKFNHNI